MASYARRGDVHLRHADDPKKKVKEILWGDYLRVIPAAAPEPGFVRVKWGDEEYWFPEGDVRTERPLEVVFVDVGQGDGCLLVTPEDVPNDRVLLVDAGAGGNMYNFVRWRFRKMSDPTSAFHFDAAVATHSDEDHYRGFQRILNERNRFVIDRLFHNGIAERTGSKPFGPVSGGFLTDLMVTRAQAETIYADPAVRGKKHYPELIHTALDDPNCEVAMLSASSHVGADGKSWLPGFEPGSPSEVTIEVLGPVVEPDGNGKPRLRTFGSKPGSTSMDAGKTKNGHSVLLRLTYREFTLVLGGDLNTPAEDFLLRHYAGIGTDVPLADAVPGASVRFRSDVMKSCHHGATDVTDEFLQAVHPFAFVVSSGDEESYVHPRPDLLGRLGKQGRGEAPLLLCTELLRSTREREEEGQLARLRQLNDDIADPATKPEDLPELVKKRDDIQQALARRNVEVYGAITLRTDGRHLVLAFRNEEDRTTDRWQTYWFRHEDGTGFVPVSAAVAAKGP